ncbi:MAG: glutaminyl-peptide cyclotransferase [Flavobacteriaceae bacterium]|nr:glutaminyl-peptide cyclotransferase [Flavobacteriaceae bacterium]
MSKLFYIPLILITLAGSCVDSASKKHWNFSFKNASGEKIFHLGDTLSIDLIQSENMDYDSVQFFVNDQKIGYSGNHNQLILNDVKLGKQSLKAIFYKNNDAQITENPIEIFSNYTPKLLKFKILNIYPHDIKAYTQGLEFVGDTLYESTGLYGLSSLRKVDYRTGKVLKKIELDKKYFGEGITVLKDKIYQLTWREKIGFVYNRETFAKIETFSYQNSAEGWGLCHDGKTIYKSDGTEKIWTLKDETLEEAGFIQVCTNTRLIESVNELEWVDGKIYANIYQRNAIAIIDPKNGAVEAVLDLSSLKEQVKQHPDLDVLNGIAYHPSSHTLFVTGKNWDKLFEISLSFE